ncbi:hypothetical protein ACIBSW_35445 [Actinoplanes sp. NPDC049668]|uniref:hypothetical protein n=1 Tax=unclassified Actinoplanes TaxID=2626549 RepID=UPI0033B6DCC2
MKTVRRTLIGFGALIMAYAVSGALTDDDVKGGALIFLVAVLVAHDGIMLPLTIGAGVLIGRIVPSRLRTPVRVAAVISLAVTVVALPLVLGRGRVPDNPSILPLHYGRGLIVVYTVIWATTAVAVAVRHRSGRIRKHLERSSTARDR